MPSSYRIVWEYQTDTGFRLLCPLLYDLNDFSGADLGFYKGGCPIHLKGAPEVERRLGWGMGRGLCPLRRNFLYFYIKMVFFSIPSDIYCHCSFQKGHSNQNGGCQDTLDTPWIRPCFSISIPPRQP